MKKSKYLLLTAILVVFSSSELAWSSSCNFDNAISRLSEEMALRASYMKTVAAIKYKVQKNHVCSYSAKQETSVISGVKQIADDLGLSQANLMAYAQLQMDLSKQIEAYWIDAWINHKATPPVTTETLEQIRLKIQAVNKTLYPAIKQAIPGMAQCSVEQVARIMSRAFSDKGINNVPALVMYYRMLASSLKTITFSATR